MKEDTSSQSKVTLSYPTSTFLVIFYHGGDSLLGSTITWRAGSNTGCWTPAAEFLIL